MLNNLIEQINEKSLRERALVFIVLFVITLLAWMELIYTPAINEVEKLTAKNNVISNEIMTTRLIVKGLEAILMKPKKDASNSNYIKREKKLKKLKEEIKNNTVKVVSAAQMVAVLKDILEKNNQLQLISMENLKVTVLNKDTSNAVSEKQDNLQLHKGIKLYQHSVLVKLKGSYTGLVDYLKTLEELEWKFIWSAVQIETDGYPNNNIELTISTLSIDKSLLEF